MRSATREIKIDEIKKGFTLIDDDIWRLTSNGFKRIESKEERGYNGYCRLKWKYKRYQYHRIYWCLHANKDVPIDSDVDHIDGNKINNHWWNLRLTDTRGNAQNRKIHRNGKVLGVSFSKKENKWSSRIGIDGKDIRLGRFDTEKEAGNRYALACDNISKYNGNNAEFRALLK